jgi:hypothetical protein
VESREGCWALKMEEEGFSEILITTYQSMQCMIPEKLDLLYFSYLHQTVQWVGRDCDIRLVGLAGINDIVWGQQITKGGDHNRCNGS